MAPRVELIFAGSDEGATTTAVGVEEAVKAIGAGAEEANRTITTGMSATLVAFRSLDQQVQQLTTDYRAGIITQKQWEAGLAAARKETVALRVAAGSLSEKELRAMSGVITKTGDVSTGASFKVEMLRNSTRALAQQAAGVQGPVGGFLSQLLMMAGGSGLVVGVAAVIGVLALAYRALAAEAMKAEKAQQDAIDRLLKLRDASRSDEVKQAEDLAQARERLTRIDRELVQLEVALIRARASGSSRDELQIQEAILERMEQRQEAQNALSSPAHIKTNRERIENEKAYEGALKASGHQLTILSIRLAHVGADREAERLALKAVELAQQGLNREQIAGLVISEQQAIQLEREIVEQTALVNLLRERAQLSRQLQGADRALRLPGAPKDRPAQPGRDTVDTEPLSQAEEFALRMTDSFGLSIDMVEDLKNSVDDLAEGSVGALGDAFEHVFEAIIEGGRVSGAEMVAGLLGAISKAAIHESAFYLARGFAALAGATFPVGNPKNAVAAGQYFKAAAIMGAVGVGAGIAANAAGGGGGDGGLSPDRIRDTGRTAQESRGELRLVLRGSAGVLAKDPEFVRSVGEAFAQAAGSQQVIIELGDGSYADVQHIGART